MIKTHKPDVVFLFETLVHKKKLEEVRVRLNLECCFSVDAVGHSGGIGVLWKTTSQISLVNFSQNYVNLDVSDEVGRSFRLTGFYGYPKR